MFWDYTIWHDQNPNPKTHTHSNFPRKSQQPLIPSLTSLTKSRASRQESAPTTERRLRPARFKPTVYLWKKYTSNFHQAFLYRRERKRRERLESKLLFRSRKQTKPRLYNSFPLLQTLHNTTARFYTSTHINDCFSSNISLDNLLLINWTLRHNELHAYFQSLLQLSHESLQ